MIRTVGMLTALMAALMLTLTACGGGDDDTATATENLTASIIQSSSADSKVTEEQADCIATGMLDKIGVEQLQKYKILDADLAVNQEIEGVDLSSGDADDLAAVYVDCIDIKKLFTEQFASGAATGKKPSAKQVECASKAITDEAITSVLSANFQGKKTNEAYQVLQQEMLACAVPAK